MAVRLTPSSLDDGLPMDEWLRLRSLQLGAGPGWADPDPGFGSGALPDDLDLGFAQPAAVDVSDPAVARSGPPDSLPMDEWQRRRTVQRGVASAAAGGNDPITLADSLPIADWQRLRGAQVSGDAAISFAGGDDSLAGGAGDDTLGGRPKLSPQQIGSGRQAEFDGDIAAGHALGGLADAARRVVASLFGGSTPPTTSMTAAGPSVAAPATPPQPPPAPRLGAERYGTGPLLGLIPKGEGTDRPDGYDMTFNNEDGNHYPPGWKKPTQLTIDQAIQMEPDARRIAGEYAVGKYQFKPKTLKELKGRMGLSGSELMTPELQDQMAEELLRKRGYEDFVAGRKTPEDFQKALALEWASLPEDARDYSRYIRGPNRTPVRARISTQTQLLPALRASRTAEQVLGAQIDGGHLPPP